MFWTNYWDAKIYKDAEKLEKAKGDILRFDHPKIR